MMKKYIYKENIYLTLDLAVVTIPRPSSNELAVCYTVYKLFHINYFQESYSKILNNQPGVDPTDFSRL